MPGPHAITCSSSPISAGELDVAIVHDFLNQRGGAERVVLEMAALFPHAPIHTSLYRPRSTFAAFAGRDVRTSRLDRLPVDERFRMLLPLYPAAFASLPRIDTDVALISSSAFAHHVRTSRSTLKAVYCYTPARWMYGGEYLGARARPQKLARPVVPLLRCLDKRAARRADLYIATSTEVRRRIFTTYGIRAPIVHPPVDVARFRPAPRGERLLVVSRLMPYKRIGLAVEAANRLGLGLDVVGAGPDLERLRSLAGPTVTFHGAADDAAVTQLMESCRTFLLPGLEDFGLAPVEAQAAGKPVVAFAGGGALDTVRDGVTGALFGESTPESLARAVLRAEHLTTAPATIADHAHGFSPATFRRRLLATLHGELAARDVRRNRHNPQASGSTIPRVAS